MPAQFQLTVELSNLDGRNGFVINGINVLDYSGTSVSSAGDVNNDGKADLIIGSLGQNGAGQAYVIFGANTLGSSGALELSDLNGQNGFILNGATLGDRAGQSVNVAGDVNNDGVTDIIIGALLASPNSQRSGQSYVVFGGASVGSSGMVSLGSLNGIDGFKLNGVSSYDTSGYSVSAAGDVNNDTIEDIIISAPSSGPGKCYVIFGGSNIGSSGTFELSDLNGANGFIINALTGFNQLGSSVSHAGDVNADGVADFIIGAPDYAGQCYVIFGATNLGSSGTVELSNLNGGNGFKINGVAANDQSGNAVRSAGDINGDGVDDIIIGANNASPSGTASGESYIIFGSVSVGSSGVLELSDLNGSNGFSVEGVTSGDSSGISVNAAGDMNHDGVDDVIIGASGADPNGGASGQTYVLFGGEQVGGAGVIKLSSLDGMNGFALNGEVSGESSGSFVAPCGDINVDGYDDFIIGARRANPNGADSGKSYVVFGDQPPTLTRNEITIAFNQLLIVDANNINATSGQYAASDIELFPVNVQRGQFELTTNPGVEITRFTQQQINMGEIAFRHAGINFAPSYAIYTKSFPTSFAQSEPYQASVNYNAPPILLANGIVITEGQTLIITTNELSATDPNDDDADLVFTISNIQHGYFDTINNPNVPITTFTQQQIYDRNIRFVHDGSSNEPFYRVSVSDGKSATIPTFAQVNFIAVNDAPVLTTNKLNVQREGLTIITSNELKASDEETPASNLVFTVANLSQGQFERFNIPNVPISSFAQRDVESALIRFNNQNADTLPSYDVGVSDGELSTIPQAATVTWASNNNGPSVVVVNQTKNDNTVRDALLSSFLIGGFCFGLIAARLAMVRLERKRLENMYAGSGTVNEDQRQFYQNSVIPIAKKVFNQIKITNFFGYISNRSMESYVSEIANIVTRLAELGIDIDLVQMEPQQQAQLINQIARQTKLQLVPPTATCSRAWFASFFKPQVTPEQIAARTNNIAVAVKAALMSGTVLDEIEMQPVLENPIFPGAGGGVGSGEQNQELLYLLQDHLQQIQEEMRTQQQHMQSELQQQRSRLDFFEQRTGQQVSNTPRRQSRLLPAVPR